MAMLAEHELPRIANFGAVSQMIAALYVQRGGVYFGLPQVDPWDKERDARCYVGPWRVVAHPPCERWGRYWGGHPRQTPRLKKGDDDGCFAAALAAVRRFGGVLEHPEGSAAWDHFGLRTPPHHGAWVASDFEGGWSCCVEQGWYGHAARKKTWLYACKVELPSLRWGPSPVSRKRDTEAMTQEERRREIKIGVCQRLSSNQRARTPIPFRDLLIGIATSSSA